MNIFLKMNLNNFRNFCSFLIIITLLNACQSDDNIDSINDQSTEAAVKTNQLILEWNQQWLELDRYTFGMRPVAIARALGYIHLASYETAVANMPGYTSNTSRLDGLIIDNNQRQEDVNLNLALNTSYALVIEHFMFKAPAGVLAGVETLKDEYEALLSQGLTATQIQNSIDWGTYVAQQVIAYSQSDSAGEAQVVDPQPVSYEPPIGPGFWTYNDELERALFPYWGSVRTFVISSDETSSVPPSAEYNESPTSEFYGQMNETFERSTTAAAEDNEDLWIAEFWSDDVEGLMMSPPGRQVSIALQLIDEKELSFSESFALLLKLGFALNDAGVSAWNDKYQYMMMRPNEYIKVFIDPTFETNLYRFINWPNPTFPGYPSGHSTFASAAGGLFIAQFGDATPFTDNSHQGRTEFRGEARSFDLFSDMARECAFSRVPFGVHMPMDCQEGLRLGYEISDAVQAFDLFSD